MYDLCKSNETESEEKKRIDKSLTHIALCHNVIKEEDGYTSSSPDELALVNGAKCLGFEFLGRDDDNNIIVNDHGVERTYEVLNIIEFTSDRKRMTVVLRDPERKIRVLCKGADSIIMERLRSH